MLVLKWLTPALRLIQPGWPEEWASLEVSTVIRIGIWAYGVLAIVGVLSLYSTKRITQGML